MVALTSAAIDLDEAAPAEILAWAAEHVPRLAVTSSFGADSAVLLHLVSVVAPRLPVLFLDTGYHFDATLDHRRRLADDLGLTVCDLSPAQTVAEQDAALGRELFARDPDRCCALRKTAPLHAALGEHDGWVTGIRRGQTRDRAATPVVGAEVIDGRLLLKAAPLARMTDADVAAYLDRHGLPRHPLVAAGYRSIGCAPCTAPSTGDDPRAGRWAGWTKTECGLHVAAGDEGTAA